MAGFEDFDNRTDRLDNEDVIFCVVCGQPEEDAREHLDCANCGHSKEHIPGERCESCGEIEEETRAITIPPQGYVALTMAGNWHKVGNSLCCSVRCALEESGYTEEHEEYHAALDAVTPKEVLTPEQVAAMPAPPSALPVADPEHMQEFGVKNIIGGEA